MTDQPLEIRSARFRYAVFHGDVADWARHVPAPHRLVIADARVLALHPRVRDAFADVPVLEIDAVEGNKTLAFAVDRVLPFLLDHGATRASTVIAIGGGIVQDLVGFVCSIVFRGLGWLFYPTTLLAQADSCIGSKTSLNHERYKNLLGTFFPPRQVIVDPRFLTTLDPLDHLSGVGEILKIHLLESAAAVAELGRELDRLWARDPDVVARCALRSLGFKRRYIEIDEYDEGPRLVLNYGHCIGHALETATGYAIPHGIAVMYGMSAANRLSVRRGWLAPEIGAEMARLCEPRLPLRDVAARADVDALLAALRRDKKNVGAKIVIIGTRGYGEMDRMIDVAPDDIRAAWADVVRG